LLLSLNLYSPFISADDTASFNVSFWAGLTSGMVSSILTGLLVGLILAYHQSQSQKFQEQKETEKEFIVFIRKLNLSFAHSAELVHSHYGLQSLPENINRILDVINEHPLLYWEDKFKKTQYKEIMNAINSLKELQMNFQEVSNQLDVKARGALVTDYNYASHISQGMSAFYCLVNGKNDEYLIDWFGYILSFSMRPDDIDELREITNRFTDLVNEYKSSRESLISSADSLKALLSNLNL